MISKTVRNCADAVAKAAAANPAPAIPAHVAVAAAPKQQGGGWTQQKCKRTKATRQANRNGPTPKFLSQGLYTQFQSTGTPMDHYPVGVQHNFTPAHKAWVPPMVPPPPASTQAASVAALVPPVPPPARKVTHQSSTSG